jgi:hypothetical protein
MTKARGLGEFFAGIDRHMRRCAAAELAANARQVREFFAGIRYCVDQKKFGRPTHAELKQFFSGASRSIAAMEINRHVSDRTQASRFNVFDFIEPDENKLSDVLALLLDPNAAHGQGAAFLGLLFQQLGLKRDTKLLISAKVRREAATHTIANSRRRMDVLVDAGALLAIENKVDALEQKDQVKDYLAHLRGCAKVRGGSCALIYLTPTGREPDSIPVSISGELQESGLLYCWSYQNELCAWLEACCRRCQAAKIRHFLSDLIAHIKTNLKRQADTTEEESNEE